MSFKIEWKKIDGYSFLYVVFSLSLPENQKVVLNLSYIFRVLPEGLNVFQEFPPNRSSVSSLGRVILN